MRLGTQIETGNGLVTHRRCLKRLIAFWQHQAHSPYPSEADYARARAAILKRELAALDEAASKVQ